MSVVNKFNVNNTPVTLNKDFINVNIENNHETAYSSSTDARNAVPTGYRKIGLQITYLLADGWFVDQYVGSDVNDWETDSNWNATTIIGTERIADGAVTIDKFGLNLFNNLGVLHKKIPYESITIGSPYDSEDGMIKLCDVTIPSLGAAEVLDIATGNYIRTGENLGGVYQCPYNYGILSFVSKENETFKIISISLSVVDNSKYSYKKIYEEYNGCSIVPFVKVLKGQIVGNELYNTAKINDDIVKINDDISDNYYGIKSVSPMVLKDFTNNILVSEKRLLENNSVNTEYYVVDVTFVNTSEIDVLDAMYSKFGNIFNESITVPYSYGVLAIAANDKKYKLISYSLLSNDKTIYKSSRVLNEYKKYNITPILYIRNGEISDNKLIRNTTLYSMASENTKEIRLNKNTLYAFENYVSNESISITDDEEDIDYCYVSSKTTISVFVSNIGISNNYRIENVKTYKRRSFVVLALNTKNRNTIINSFTYNKNIETSFENVLNGYKDYIIIPLLYIDYGKIVNNFMAAPYYPSNNSYFKFAPTYLASHVIQEAVTKVELITTDGKPIHNFAISSIRNGDGDTANWAISFTEVNRESIDNSRFIIIGNNSVETQEGINEYELNVSNINIPTLKSIKITVDWSKVPKLGINYQSYGWLVCTILSDNAYIKQEKEIKRNSYIVVDANGNGDYTSLQEAIDNAGDSKNNPKVIMVMPGTYVMPAYDSTTRYKGNNRYLSIIGTDRNSCIIRNDNGYYNVSPYVDNGVIKMQGQIYIANLTIISTDNEYEPPTGDNMPSDSPDNWHRAYCIHFDFAAEDDTICEVNNCVLKNNHYANIGCGNKGVLRFVNCIMETEMYDPTRIRGCIYTHDSNIDREYKLEIINCILTSSHVPITVIDAYNKNISMLMINNVATNKSGGAKITYNTEYHSFDSRCFGNNFETV